MANNNKKYVSLTRLSTFLDNIKTRYSLIGHKHTTKDITDYVVDSSLSSTSTNPVQNKVLNAEFDAISQAMQVLDATIDDKADSTHDHNSVYYQKNEIDQKLSNKSDKTHNHDSVYSAIDHNHDGVYATVGHNHDAKYEPKGTASSAVSSHNTNTTAHNDIRDLITGLTTRLNTLANSDDTTLDQLSEIVTYIKNNKSLIDGITTSKVNVSDIVNNLTTNVTNKPLSAAQGVAIKSLINDLQAELDGHTHKVANITDLTVSASELNHMDGITENVQLQFDRITDAKADWSQNDETAIDYVKNRTHWIDDPVATEIFAERTIGFTDTYVESTMGTMLVEGCTYVVTWNGVQYECLARNDGYDDIYIGNQSLSDGWNFPESIASSEPFFIATYEPDNWSVIRVSKTGSYTVKIIGMISEVHEISEKFIPKSIARAEDLIGKNGTGANAEIFNDYSNNVASGEYSHAEGYKTTASEMYAHSEGNQSIASGHASHAEGAYNEASGWISHAEGFSTIAASDRQHVQGANNIADTEGKYLHIVGNGSRTSVDTDRSNAHTIDWNGNGWFQGDVYVGGTSQADASKLISKADQRWNLIYDSGEISAIANSISNIDVSGYTNIQVLVRCYNDGDSIGSRAGSAIFTCANGKTYQFPVWSSMFSKSINTVYTMATFNLVDGWLVCPYASRLIGDATTFDDEGGTAGNLALTGSGMMKCTSQLSTLTISSLDQNANYYFGMGSRVMVWGWNA